MGLIFRSLRTDDPVADFARWDKEETEWLEKHPKCEECEEHIIQKDIVCIHGAWYCNRCLRNMLVRVGDD